MNYCKPTIFAAIYFCVLSNQDIFAATYFRGFKNKLKKKCDLSCSLPEINHAMSFGMYRLDC